MEEIFYRFNPWWEEEFKINFIDRPKYTIPLLSSIDKPSIEIITGLRRIGKTSIMKILINKLINEKNVQPNRIFFISLDFYKLEDLSVLDIVEEYLKLQKIPFSERIYLFLDEITYKKDFSVQLKNIYDLYNAKIFVSSSSASVLKDKKAYLTGREKITEVLPLDFDEFLNFKEIKIKKADKHLLKAYFEDYMKIGGIPEYVLTEDIEYIKQLVDDIIYKDIIAMHNIKEKTAVREFFFLLMERAGKQLSLNKISKVLGISVDTAKRFFEYFLDTYIIYAIERCGKLNKRLKSPKKIYAGDVGIRNMITGFRDLGAVFENLVFLKIKNRKSCYVLHDGIELDFLTEDKILIEAKYERDLNEKQLKLFNEYPAKEKILVDSFEKYQSL
ncbi:MULTISPECIES: ATP-binding protein [Persephonella]|uniref:Archaeal ATPase family protein n=1 Tax=Persephonella marina (strain DSM 14350 / EX-H1) TaxID=123214 RepID=C0QQZ2_PERMH|nr:MULTISPECIES: ATP-binding protein [Persephonella]ACO04483.1 archaeal ATPase family protein [Persephonella marina EX-H1]